MRFPFSHQFIYNTVTVQGLFRQPYCWGIVFPVISQRQNLTADFLVSGSYDLSVRSSSMFPEAWIQGLCCRCICWIGCIGFCGTLPSDLLCFSVTVSICH